MSQSTDAILLRMVDYKEKHRIISIFTRDLGRISVMARSARTTNKRYNGHLDLFHQGNAIIKQPRSGGLATLTTFQLTNGFEHLRTDLMRFAIASFWAELALNTTAEGDVSPRQFEILTTMLNLLNQSNDGKRYDLILGFQLVWFQAMGVLPPLDNDSLASAGVGTLEDQHLAVARALLENVSIPDLDGPTFQAVGALTRRLRNQATTREFVTTRFLTEMLLTGAGK